ncbi:GIY-YIG nuclease family protein [Aquimarina sp. U1-2]|uniref:GIY-YIG nuclease family protein n=1 Tax=Aquimarina sp. U1-2 TaxID=2823141 RepID=UPI001AECE049|nr:GIY-YIG nuclease family protein [Aquimarina sp. U1-2]MBP2832626.1 GIY-YIG nuclease family protein [Aquimarina sp. U1-2]
MKKSYTYIMTNKHRTTFYIGVTADLKERITAYQSGIGSKFTTKYNLTELVYFEEFTNINEAISREKQLKNWKKDWKINLIKKLNPKLETLEI